MNLEAFLSRYRLPGAFAETVKNYYVPLAHWVARRMTKHDAGAFVLGINGAQGTGKSTLANFLSTYLAEVYDFRVAELSIDDIYLTRAEREDLARRVHPLLATRGVPGTHDVDLGLSVIDGLCELGAGESLSLPRFDKSVDDRGPAETWPVVVGPVDLVIFEGWCVGSTASPESDFAEPLNRLEAEEDTDGTWRRYVNAQLASAYRGLFDRIDALVVLQAPGFEAIHRWRLEQESKLAAPAGSNAAGVMDEAELARFIEHYERITRRNLDQLSQHADIVLTLDDDHSVTRAS